MAETVSGTLQRRSTFDSKSWWTKWHWDKFFSLYFGILLSVSFHQCCTLIFINMFLLSETQMSEAWGTSKRLAFGYRKALEMKVNPRWIFFCETLKHVVFLYFILHQPNSLTYLHFPEIYVAFNLPLQEQVHPGNIQSNKFCPPPAINTVPLATSSFSYFFFFFFFFFNIHSNWWFVKQVNALQKQYCDWSSR